MAQQRLFRCAVCSLTLPAAEEQKHLTSSAHLFRAAAKGPVIEVSSDEGDAKKKRQDPQDRSVRQGAPKRSRVEPVFVEDLSRTDSGGESPVRAVNIVAVPSDDSSDEAPAKKGFRMQQPTAKETSRAAWWKGTRPKTLHVDILRFCEWMSPTDAEVSMRADITARYSTLVTRLWPSAHAAAFGSTRTSLFLPMSDVDLVVLGKTSGHDPLAKLSVILRASGLARDVNYISHAKVPIVKFVDKHTGCCVDLCLNQNSGISSSRIVQAFMKEMSALRPLVFVLKFFLHQHGFSETYTGGIGSYCIVLMVVSYLQLQLRKWDAEKIDLGAALLGFLEFYGDQFNYYRTGISVVNGGSYFDKAARGLTDHERPYLLCVEDPDSPSNDVGRNSYEIRAIRNVFSKAHKELKQHTSLAEVLTILPTLLQRRKRAESLYGGAAGGTGKK